MPVVLLAVSLKCSCLTAEALNILPGQKYVDSWTCSLTLWPLFIHFRHACVHRPYKSRFLSSFCAHVPPNVTNTAKKKKHFRRMLSHDFLCTNGRCVLTWSPCCCSQAPLFFTGVNQSVFARYRHQMTISGIVWNIGRNVCRVVFAGRHPLIKTLLHSAASGQKLLLRVPLTEIYTQRALH